MAVRLSNFVPFLCVFSSVFPLALEGATLYTTSTAMTVSNRANKNRSNSGDSGGGSPGLDFPTMGEVENRPPPFARPTKSAAATPFTNPKSASRPISDPENPSSTPQSAMSNPKSILNQSNSTKPAENDTTTPPTDASSQSSVTPLDLEGKSTLTTVISSTSPPPHTGFVSLAPTSLAAVSPSPLKIILTWSTPKNISQSFIAGYTVHYFLSKFTSLESLHKSIHLGPDVTSYNMTNVSPGTNYTIFVIVNYTNHVSVSSNKVSVVTLGYGPDRECICDPMGAMNATICDAITGQCRCRKFYAGLGCEKCRAGFYRFKNSPCASCPCNTTVSTGVCSTDGNQVMCSCRGTNIGPTCELCKKGHYIEPTTALCTKCNCNGNTKLNSPYICEETTGKCIDCQYNTTGLNCEKCLPGYAGDPIQAKNCTKVDSKNSTSPTVSIVRKLTKRGEVVVGISVTFGVIFFVVVGVIGCRRYMNWRRWQPQPFWTVELKDDHESVSFSSVIDQEYQNVDAALLMDDVGYYDTSMQGQLRVKSPENNPSYHSINA